MKTIVIYHGNCKDGFAAAWAAWDEIDSEDVEYYPAQHGTDPPDVVGKRVYILDFSYKRPVMEKLIEDAFELTVLDHHKTAEAELEGLPGCHFDMNRSGAMMAWEFFNPGIPAPWTIRYVQDRDLWRWELPDSEAINAYISSLPYEFEMWDCACWDVNTVVEYGYAVLRRNQQYVESTAARAMRIDFEGHNVPIVNATYMDISEVLDHLRKGEPFAMGWHQGPDGGFNYSLRSTDESVDVSEIAKKYGGGGHRNAAGFRVERPVHFKTEREEIADWVEAQDGAVERAIAEGIREFRGY